MTELEKREIRISEDLLTLEILAQKADVVLDDLRKTYFIETNPSREELAALYADAEIRSSIISDYMHEIKDTIESISRNLRAGAA